ncbi:adult-specific rigid cuticular protein 15.7 [Rhipicephalus microplus]|uniref:adult-specific rigid cuticular protein 15.7 n=1 Tax=Rhipicephalus microplus TaxID=6941 RepID=UPI003F6BF3D3
MLSQVIVFLGVAAVAFGGYAGGHHGGSSRTYRKQDDYGHYRFGYDIVNGYGAVNGRHEAGHAYGPVHGSYYLGDIDGRHRQVHYVADKLGFRAVVKTNEPGTKTSLPAAAPYITAHGKSVPAYGHGGYGGYGGFGYGGHGYGGYGYGGYGYGGYGYGGHGYYG